MKLRFLDARNCHSLLPPTPGVQSIHLLDEYLGKEVNDREHEGYGSIDALIERNKKTLNRKRGSNRLYEAPVEISMELDARTGLFDFQSIAKPWPGPTLLHFTLVYQNGLNWKIVIPLQFILKGWGDAEQGYQGYVHSVSHFKDEMITITSQSSAPLNTSGRDFHYVGITGRHWLLRLHEHTREMLHGSRKRFHQAWMKSLGMSDAHFVSQLGNINLTYEEAMNWEEHFVDRLPPGTRLNMISGGFKGLRELHEHRITKSVDISLEERDHAILEFARRHPKKGIPHPLMSGHWKDDGFYLRNIEARSNTLSAEQVRRIRKLDNEGLSVAEITEDVGARNQTQVKNVIRGKTYIRIQ